MSVHDTIGDFITVIRNAGLAGKSNCSYPHSNLRAGIAKILKERMAGTNLEEIAGKVNASVMSAENVTLSSSNVTNIGNEPAVVGTAFGMEVNATSKPVAGNSGVFVVRLKANNPVAIPDNFDQQKSAGTTQLRSNAKNRAFEALKDLSGMEDNRERVNVIGN